MFDDVQDIIWCYNLQLQMMIVKQTAQGARVADCSAVICAASCQSLTWPSTSDMTA